MNVKKTWWKESIIYQIYPRSFKDSNGDGIGDLQGIISKLDYIASLGVDILWLNPIYRSPNKDASYDVSDYRNIMTDFGTMADFDELLEKVHEKGMKLMLDLVVDYCSDQHLWFQEAKKSRNNQYYDYFHWWPAEKGTPPERWSPFDEDENGWTYNEATDAYYLSDFSEYQPCLNWDTPALREEVYEMMRFWLNKGINGFRMDVITFIGKDTSYPDIAEHLKALSLEYRGPVNWLNQTFGPNLHKYLKEMNEKVLRHYDIITMAEGVGTTTDNILDLVAEDRNEINTSYHIDIDNLGFLASGYMAPGYKNNLKLFKNINTNWANAFKEKGWGTNYLTNHDCSRMLTKWGNDTPEFRVASAKMLNTFLISMRGIPILYQGDEIGMTNANFNKIEDYNDALTINYYRVNKKRGKDLEQFIEDSKIRSRDNSRTPVQWDNSSFGGFSTSEPWLKINDNYKEINVEQQESDPDSVLNYFRKMIQIRKNNPIFIYGDYDIIDPKHNDIYAFSRTLDNEKVIVLLNFREHNKSIDLTSENIEDYEILINNYESFSLNDNKIVELLPYQATLIKV